MRCKTNCGTIVEIVYMEGINEWWIIESGPKFWTNHAGVIVLARFYLIAEAVDCFERCYPFGL
jgi:hypothetical protein